jgi:multiple RNA-binding domain-containing protein 1
MEAERRRKETETKAAAPVEAPSLKRKRELDVAADPKLQEFLEVMQPKLKTKAQLEAQHMEEPPTKVQGIEVPEGESDDEYEIVPKKARKDLPKPAVAGAPEPVASHTIIPPTPAVVPEVADIVVEQPSATNEAAETVQPVIATGEVDDDDWLRSRTNRLLDIVEPEQLVVSVVDASTATIPPPVPTTTTNQSEATGDAMDIDEAPEAPNQTTSEQVTTPETSDATMDAIRKNGRLFVRNLPYSATEDELRMHFEKYGAVEEVCFFSRVLSCSLCFHDEYPDRDSLCFSM